MTGKPNLPGGSGWAGVEVMAAWIGYAIDFTGYVTLATVDNYKTTGGIALVTLLEPPSKAIPLGIARFVTSQSGSTFSRIAI